MFAIVSTGIVLATLDQFIVNIAFPSIEHSLHGSVSTLSWVLNGYSIVFAALLVPAGRLGQKLVEPIVVELHLELFVETVERVLVDPAERFVVAGRIQGHGKYPIGTLL